MCPICLAAAALLAVKATSAASLAALAINRVRAKNLAHEFPMQPENKEDQNGQHDDCN
jgi:hypothetical protein